jgi:threonine dehydrogenase-like Zn-dependent dehydrogenase
MRAVVSTGPGRLELVDVPEPVAATGEVVVAVGAVGLCGTDLHMAAGERPGWGFPVRLGHEIGGTVLEGAAGVPAGAVVAVDPYVPCDTCRVCRRGQWEVCPSFRAHGVALPGGLTERMAVPVGRLHRVDGDVEAAAMVEPVAVAAMALHRAGVAAGDRVVVLGAGPIGLALVIAATDAGVDVLVSEPLPARREVAAALGGRVTGTEGLAAVVADWTDGHGAEAVLEASGSRSARDGAPGLVAPGGRLVLVGVGDGDLAVPVARVQQEGVQVTGARAGLFREAVAILGRRRADVLRLVSHRFPLAAVGAAFQQARDHPEDTGKVLVRT